MAATANWLFAALQCRDILRRNIRRHAMSTHNNSRFGRFFSAAAQSLNFAILAERLTHTPDGVFKARGTTRQQAIRDLADRL